MASEASVGGGSAAIPVAAWKRRFDDLPDMTSFQPSMPGIWESLTLIPLAIRMKCYVDGELKEGREPIFDLNGPWLQPPIPGPYQGVPLGGIGGGCVGRGFRGDFRRWNLNPGKHIHKVVYADQFSVRVKRGSKIYTQVLSVEDGKESGALQSWTWGLKPHRATTHALYPRSWTVYEEAVPLIRLTCRQISPVIPHDYVDASLPVGVFVWAVENLGTSPAEVSIMFTFQNGAGSSNDYGGGHYNKPFVITDGEKRLKTMGVQLHHQQRLTGVNFANATDKEAGLVSEVPQCGRIDRGVSHGSETSEKSQKIEETRNCACSVCKDFGGRGGSDEGERPTAAGKAALMGSEEGLRSVEALSDPLTFAIGAEIQEGVNISLYSQFSTALPGGDDGNAAKELWEQFTEHGELKDPSLTPEWWNEADVVRLGRTGPAACGVGKSQGWSSADTESALEVGGPAKMSAKKDAVASALCQKVTVAAHECQTLSFALSWDMPIVRFGGGLGLPRRYTRFFGKDGNSSGLMASYALCNYPKWERQIVAWQQPVLEDPTLPTFYKHMLFNELYYVTNGGTVWTDSRAGVGNCRDPAIKTQAEQQLGDGDLNEVYRHCHGNQDLIGQFMYLEGHEYLMYNTYDVHFYASFALAILWPMLELSLQQDVAAAVMSEDLSTRRLIARGEIRTRKVRGSVPHDMGCPSGFPWSEVNAYNLQDCNNWKDLGPKFVLQVYRDYIVTKSDRFLREMWPVIVHVMQRVQEYDRDGDGLIENSGFPDQTYDIWRVDGPSAYTGSLWVAALSATAAIGQVLGNTVHTDYYRILSERARNAYVKRLWNGRYFNYDNSSSRHSDSIMADQMAGQWYARACGLPPVVDASMARSSLTTVFEYNVKRFADGMSGAVNGMRPNGAVDYTCLQSKEVWTGTTYSVAAAMLQEAAYAEQQAEGDSCTFETKEEAQFLRHAAFETARGLYEAGWNRYGFWFCTPEAWDEHGHYRSLSYMRPLCIWAMQWALTHGKAGGQNAEREVEKGIRKPERREGIDAIGGQEKQV